MYHGVFDPARDFAVFHLVAKQDVAAEIAAEYVALLRSHEKFDD